MLLSQRAQGHTPQFTQRSIIHLSLTLAGDECFLARGRRATRHTEVRIACSPDQRVHLLVREPDFCSYIFVVYSPALCGLPAYKPVPVVVPEDE